MSTPFTPARRLGLRLVNTDFPVSPRSWGNAVLECQASLRGLGLHDPAVDDAAPLAAWLGGTTGTGAIPARAFALPSAPVPGLDARAARAGARDALTMVTHAAVKSATGPVRTLLESAEWTLLAPGTPRTAEDVALQGWRSLVTSLDPETLRDLAPAIAHQQHDLIRRAAAAVAGVRPTDPDVLTRLRSTLDTQEGLWKSLTTTSRSRLQGRRRPLDPRAIRALDRASRSVAAALGLASPRAALTALLRSGIGGSLVTAVALAGPDSPLTASAVQLEQLARTIPSEELQDPTPPTTDPLGQAGAGQIRVEQHPAPTPRDATDIPGNSRPTSPPHPPPPAAEDLPHVSAGIQLTPEVQVELGRRMEAGVIAAAALLGDETAKAIANQASDHDLQRISRDGRWAKAQLLAGTAPVPGMVMKSRGFRDRSDDTRQHLLAHLAAQIERWDYTRKGWLGFAIQETGWQFNKLASARLNTPEDVYVEQDALERFPEVTDPDQTNDVEFEDVRHWVTALPPEERSAVTSTLGLVTGHPETFREQAATTGASESTTARRFHNGMVTIRSHIAWADLCEQLDPDTQLRDLPSEDLVAAFDALPEPLRAAMTARLGLDGTIPPPLPQTAQELGIEPSEVLDRVNAGVTQLRQALSPAEELSPAAADELLTTLAQLAAKSPPSPDPEVSTSPYHASPVVEVAAEGPSVEM